MEKRFCAHRGVSALMPENTMPAFGAALALGADEIEFDIRPTKDGKMVISHDPKLERISNGAGLVAEHTLQQLRQLRIGGGEWQVGFCTPEEVFARFANQITFNIHLKDCGEDGWIVRELAQLIAQYGAEERAYFAGSPTALENMVKYAPQIRRVAIQLKSDTIAIEEMASRYDCSGVQFWWSILDPAAIGRLHAEGRFCNLFYADAPADYEKYFSMGIDTLLTNRMDLANRWRAEM